MVMKKQLICITCPRSCHLDVECCDGKIAVSGNMCPRGVKYAETEITDPRRVVTAVMRCDSAEQPFVPVRSAEPYPKAEIPALLNKLYKMCVKTPVCGGDVIGEFNGIKIIATESRKGEPL